ncbi:MAG: hypothetical protein KKG99_05010 [Bacteroidetes bacterium]|nr:hypothetical protein [Bacteroidota bacterium]
MMEQDKLHKKLKFELLQLGLILGLVLVSFGNLPAQTQTGAVLPLFQSESMIQLKLRADFNQVFANSDDKTYFPATLTWDDVTSHRKEFEIEIRTRGTSRRMPDICAFTPLRLRFSEDGLSNTIFEGQKAIKLVTHCNKAAVYEQNTIIEYLIYKAFNLLTDSSFKVRPAMINYVYNDRKNDSIQRFAFFIEREMHVAKRLNGVELDSVKIHTIRLNPYHTCLMDMFQFMIGNTDYSTYELHNVIILKDEEQKLPGIAIPYDFDWSGMVSAYYAKPNSILKTQTVQERVYRGFKKPIEIINTNIQLFNSRKKEIYDLFNNFELLKKSEKKRIIKYLDEFYQIINHDKQVGRVFIENARILHN